MLFLSDKLGNDELITKEELDERINEEIQEIVSMIKDEIYK